MVSKKKIEVFKGTKELAGKHAVIGILDMYKLPARQLREIREKLREKAVIRMIKKRMMKLMLKELKMKGIEGLEAYIQGEPALLLSNENPFRLARIIEESKSEASAKAGDIASKDIVIKQGPTNLAPGPAIGELQRLKLPVGVEGDKIAVKKDTVVAKAGEQISKEVAVVLGKLGIKPMEIGLNMVAAWENGFIYPRSLLFIPTEKYVEKIKHCAASALNLSVYARIFTRQSTPLMLAKASREAKALALEANIITPESIGMLLAKANAQAQAIMKKAR
jgi:large subunit ribosomal protein L10